MRGEHPARVMLPGEPVPAGSGRSGRRRGRTGAPAADEAPLDAAGEARFEALRRWRLGVAREESVPAYVVASDRSLRDVAARRPGDRAELLLCHGIGPAKAERYGEAMLEVLAGATPAPGPSEG
jgi:ATP-dependent DNA helicase RecQ